MSEVELPTVGDSDKACEQCRWWCAWDFDANDKVMTGHCRRHAPRPWPFQGDRSLETCWPNTSYDDWCGEWQPIPTPAPPAPPQPDRNQRTAP